MTPTDYRGICEKFTTLHFDYSSLLVDNLINHEPRFVKQVNEIKEKSKKLIQKAKDSIFTKEISFSNIPSVAELAKSLWDNDESAISKDFHPSCKNNIKRKHRVKKINIKAFKKWKKTVTERITSISAKKSYWKLNEISCRSKKLQSNLIKHRQSLQSIALKMGVGETSNLQSVSSSFIEQNSKIEEIEEATSEINTVECNKTSDLIKRKVPLIRLYEKQINTETPSDSLATTVTVREPSWKDYFLPPKEESCKEYTLVLDLDETLIHYPDNNDCSFDQDFYLLRPGLHKFLDKMSKYFEIVIFTAGTKEYADYILDQIDFKKTISHRLYRHHTKPDEDVYQKDLDELGRDLK